MTINRPKKSAIENRIKIGHEIEQKNQAKNRTKRQKIGKKSDKKNRAEIGHEIGQKIDTNKSDKKIEHEIRLKIAKEKLDK